MRPRSALRRPAPVQVPELQRNFPRSGQSGGLDIPPPTLRQPAQQQGTGGQRIELSDATTASRPAPEGAVFRSTRWSTRVDMIVTEPSAVVVAADLLGRELDVVEAVASRFRVDSELNELHGATAMAGGAPVPVSSGLLAEAITIGLRAAELTGGAVDPTVGVALCRLGYDRDFPWWPMASKGIYRGLHRFRGGGRSPSTSRVDRHNAPRGGHRPRRHGQGLGCGPGGQGDRGGTSAAACSSPSGGISPSAVHLEGDSPVGIADVCGDTAAPSRGDHGLRRLGHLGNRAAELDAGGQAGPPPDRPSDRSFGRIRRGGRFRSPRGPASMPISHRQRPWSWVNGP